MTTNIDNKVVADFGAEWSAFDQISLSAEEQLSQFQPYFPLNICHLKMLFATENTYLAGQLSR